MLKKVLIGLAAVLSLLLLGIVLLGATSREVTYDNEVRIERPVAETWAVFADPVQATRWVQGLQSMEVVEGSPMQVGSRARLRFREGGRTVDVLETVTACEPPTRFAFDLEAEGTTGRGEMRFEADGPEVTRLRATTTMRGDGLVSRAMMRLLRGAMEERTGQDFERLARLVESGAIE